MSRRTRRGGSARAGSVPGSAWLRFPVMVVCVAYACGQVFRDRWLWSEWLFWAPSWGVALGAAIAALVLWRRRVDGRRVAWSALMASAVALWSGGRFLMHDVGWAFSMPAAMPGDMVVTHWNARWPGEEALDRAQAISQDLGDLAIISNPGSMFLSSLRADWMPDDMRSFNLGAVGIVTRLRVMDFRMVAHTSMGRGLDLWFAWLVVRAPSGAPVRILIGDLPSSPTLARGDIAARASAMLGEADIDGPPDMVVGDFNCTPSSVVFDAVAPGLGAAPPWRSAGWLCTYWRPWPILRIDAMLAGPGLDWRGYRTFDTGIGEHRAQQGILRAASAER